MIETANGGSFVRDARTGKLLQLEIPTPPAVAGIMKADCAEVSCAA